jgi:molecular chaperone DnaK (HSP70)
MMTDWTLCIDFGTAFSKAAAAPVGAWSRFEPSAVRPLQLAGHERSGNAFLLDSAVFVDDARVLFGRAALARADALAHKKRMALRSFKTLLSVSDLDRALNTNAPASIDPHRVFQMRDLIVLYLAYVLATTERAIAADAMVSKAVRITRRYAAPAWRAGDSAGLHDTIVRLFGEAEAFRIAAGKRLLAAEGMSMTTISDALPKAMASARPYEMGLIFEATAAAAYTSIGLTEGCSHLIVLDVGAGTADVAALARQGGRTVELREARVTLKQAGDFIDRVIANMVLDQAAWARTPEQKAELWAVLMRQMRDIKETVFADGRTTLRHQGRTVSLAMRDIERNEDFRDFVANLAAAYERGLAVVRQSAARARSNVQAVAVGGGAGAPFVQELLRRRAPRGPRIIPRPATPDWAHAREFQGNLAPVFPQLAIAIGGALAPEDMLAAQAGVSLPAGDRSDSLAARD